MTNDDGWDIQNPGVMTTEESALVCALLDERLTENEHQFVQDMADVEDGEHLTDRQAEWLQALAVKYRI